MLDDLLPPGDHQRTIDWGGRRRSYLLHIPLGWDGQGALPLVLAFHGGATDGAFMARFSGLNEQADAARFAVAYPDGTGEQSRMLTWNAGRCCGYARRHAVDDLGFIQALLDDLHGVINLDARRVYATGISNGAMMAYRLAVELSNRVAAIAAVAGTMEVESFTPGRPVPILHFHGTADEFVPHTGGRGARSLSQLDFSSVDDLIQAWVEFDGCQREPVVERLPRVSSADLAVARHWYPPDRTDAEVVLYLIEGGGHTWPGRQSRITALGRSTLAVSANETMWEFFARYALP